MDLRPFIVEVFCIIDDWLADKRSVSSHRGVAFALRHCGRWSEEQEQVTASHPAILVVVARWIARLNRQRLTGSATS